MIMKKKRRISWFWLLVYKRDEYYFYEYHDKQYRHVFRQLFLLVHFFCELSSGGGGVGGWRNYSSK